MEKADPFSYLAFILQFAPATGPAAVEVPLREKLARIGIEAGKPFPTVALTAADKAAMAAGIQQAEPLIKAKIATLGEQVNGWVNSHSMRLDRSGYDGDWARRSAVVCRLPKLVASLTMCAAPKKRSADSWLGSVKATTGPKWRICRRAVSCEGAPGSPG